MKEKLNALLQEGREKILAAKNETELQDIKAAILGKALYTGRLNLKTVIEEVGAC